MFLRCNDQFYSRIIQSFVRSLITGSTPNVHPNLLSLVLHIMVHTAAFSPVALRALCRTNPVFRFRAEIVSSALISHNTYVPTVATEREESEPQKN